MKLKLRPRLVAILISIIIVVGLYWQVNAQEEIVDYLYKRFEQKNISVIDITVLERSPLSLQVIIQGQNPWLTAEDVRTMKLVDREVLIFARQQGYVVDSYTRILVGSDGKQLDITIQKSNVDRISEVNFSKAILPDIAVQYLVVEEIGIYLNDYELDNLELDINISSDDGLQTLTLLAKANSIEQANTIAYFLWSFAHFPLIDNINEKGARIVFYRAKIIDQNNENLFDYIFDTEMGSGGWTIDNRLQNPSGDGPPSSPLLETDSPNAITPEETIEETATSTPTETITPTP